MHSLSILALGLSLSNICSAAPQGLSLPSFSLPSFSIPSLALPSLALPSLGSGGLGSGSGLSSGLALPTALPSLGSGLGGLASGSGFALPTAASISTPTVPTGFVKRQSATGACATGIHMIVARGSTEAAGQGLIGQVATAVQNAVPGSDSEAVDYPASLTDYLGSEASGVADMTKLIQAYAAKCPDSKIGLLGYSQGGQIVGDVLCGTSEVGLTASSAIDASLLSKVVAAVQYGDPSHVVGQPQNVGTSTHNGILPRGKACGAITSVMKSFCTSGDPFCDSGSDIAVHLGYFTANDAAAASFIESQVNGVNATA
ncbi:Acetylxylan esterase [Lachnellula hyalina]|uniref:Acetylxylan esterase n=1 Tax=Lachnellula hyalina TaxID=1316788 RepID=A0A8H8R695_9HELO|nr:Acetylxylan esterase [Lachnellula hyalina]TVY29324.1 Acetylxylan esterase [Lachnellula hyalina]